MNDVFVLLQFGVVLVDVLLMQDLVLAHVLYYVFLVLLQFFVGTVKDLHLVGQLLGILLFLLKQAFKVGYSSLELNDHLLEVVSFFLFLAGRFADVALDFLGQIHIDFLEVGQV